LRKTLVIRKLENLGAYAVNLTRTLADGNSIDAPSNDKAGLTATNLSVGELKPVRHQKQKHK